MNLMRIKHSFDHLQALRCFVAVASHGGFTRAAEETGLGQPNISRHILNLEAILEVKLLNRVGRETHLTSAGKELLPMCQDLFARMESIEKRARDISCGSAGVVRVGATPHTLTSLVLPFLNVFAQSHPRVQVHLMEDSALGLLDCLLDSSLDFAVSSFITPPDCEYRRLFPVRLHLLVPLGHKWCNRRYVDCSELEEQPLLLLRGTFMSRQLLDKACLSYGWKPTVSLESSSAEALISFVEANRGLAIVPSTVILKSRNVVPLTLRVKGVDLSTWMSLVWIRHRYLSPAGRQLIASLCQYSKARNKLEVNR
jgi:DNA-binding transcriptional LysR family regulator